jgi:hypothetical protein
MDGDAKYTALANPGVPAVASPEGLPVTTFRFIALTQIELTQLVIEPTLGKYSTTTVFGADYPNQVVTGELHDADVSVMDPAGVSTGDLSLPAGRRAYVVASGNIEGESTAGVTVMVEIVPRAGNTGTVLFTEPPPVDIFELDNPWPDAGAFQEFDTDLTGSITLNGSITDNGTYIPEPVVFSGMLAAFPVVTSADAEGTWDVMLSTSVGDSNWQGVPTILGQGTAKIAAMGDCTGDGWIDLYDSLCFQVCFTGLIGPLDPPGYPLAAELSCSVFDFDEDGAIDLADYADFRDVMSGPGS